MNHPSGDTLLKYVLETLDNSETEAVRQHLSSCEECSKEEQKINGEVRRLSSIDIPLGTEEPPQLPRRPRALFPVLKVAAVLAVGFFIGYATAELSNPIQPIPVQDSASSPRISMFLRPDTFLSRRWISEPPGPGKGLTS